MPAYQPSEYPNLTIINHPLIQHKLSLMRKKETSTNNFRRLLKEITLLMGYELTRDLSIENKTIETPLETMEAPFIAGKKVVIIPILRAGLGMSDGLTELIPSARIGHIGVYRDEETKQPVEYYKNFPKAEGRFFIVVDPMLATGNSSAYAIKLLNNRGIDDSRIRFLSLVSAPEGVKNFSEQHPTLKIYTASLDRELDANAYIRPGLGDAGDRLFGTK
jgi:uracil phosphoribosyltransferase